MKIIAIAIAIAITSVACVADGPTRPTRASADTNELRRIAVPSGMAERLPMIARHGDTVSMPDGTIAFVCVTQPRVYTADGTQWYERDRYVSVTRCPIIPID